MKLEELLSNMLHHEMQALRVLNKQLEGKSSTFAELEQPWVRVPFNETINLDFLLTGPSVSGLLINSMRSGASSSTS